MGQSISTALVAASLIACSGGGGGSSTGGSAGSGATRTGATGSGGSPGGSSSGGWTCLEDAQTKACGCLKGPGGPQTTCAATYACCYTWDKNGTPACNCDNESAADCTTVVSVLASGAKVTHCPP